MSYFDTVRCHSCRAQIDPESLGGRSGLTCPSCGAALNPADLFGLSDAFLEEEAPDLTLDDLVPGAPPPRRPSAPARDPREASRQAPGERRQIAGPTASAAELMKQMKKGR